MADQNELRVFIRLPVTRTETDDSIGTESGADVQVRHKETSDLCINHTVTGFEECARFLYDLITSTSGTIHNLLPEEIRAFESEYRLTRSESPGTISIKTSALDPAVVYQTARLSAYHHTKTNMVRAGYSPDRTLLSWFRNDLELIFSGVDYADVEFPKFNELVRNALETYCLKEHPCGGIDKNETPDPTSRSDKSQTLDVATSVPDEL